MEYLFAARRSRALDVLATAIAALAAVVPIAARVLILGGSDNRDWRGKMDSAEINDPAAGTFADAGRMSAARFKLTNAAVRLPDGKVLIAGGGAC